MRKRKRKRSARPADSAFVGWIATNKITTFLWKRKRGSGTIIHRFRIPALVALTGAQSIFNYHKRNQSGSWGHATIAPVETEWLNEASAPFLHESKNRVYWVIQRSSHHIFERFRHLVAWFVWRRWREINKNGEGYIAIDVCFSNSTIALKSNLNPSVFVRARQVQCWKKSNVWGETIKRGRGQGCWFSAMISLLKRDSEGSNETACGIKYEGKNFIVSDVYAKIYKAEYSA